MGLELDTLKNNEYTTVIVNNTTGEITNFMGAKDLNIKVNAMGCFIQEKFSYEEIENFLNETCNIYTDFDKELKDLKELFK